MAPRRFLSSAHIARGASDVQPTFSAQKSSWQNPENILDILMLIGGDIVQRAVAQLAGAGPGPFCPVAFSFGWLGYSVAALTCAVGDGRLLPQPDTPAYVVNARSGYTRENASWVLGRLLRDRETRKFKGGSLTIAFYRTAQDNDLDPEPDADADSKSLGVGWRRKRPRPRTGVPSRDWVYWCGVAVIVAQLAIAVIPGALNGNWVVLIVTVGGTALALTGAGLGQWRDEKYAARRVDPRRGREAVVLTRGNGSTFAMVVVSDRAGIRLEDLAAARSKRRTTTSVATAAHALLWLALLLTVEGLDSDTWYLLAVGGLGMVQNVVAAGATRSAAALGFHFEESVEGDFIKEHKVMQTLMKAEEREPGVGLALLPIFFPGELWPDEQEYWDKKRKEKAEAEAAKRALRKQVLVKIEEKKAPPKEGEVTLRRRNDPVVTVAETVRPPPVLPSSIPPSRRQDTSSTMMSDDSLMGR